MGYMKELWMHQQEAGYSQLPGEKYVCPSCVTDPFLSDDLAGSLEDEDCSYCGARGAADLMQLLDLVADFVGSEFQDPANQLPFESREGGYQGVVYDGYEVIQDLPDWTDSDDLLEDVSSAFGGSAWCERDYYSLKEDDRLRYGWRTFVEIIKHETRFLFFGNPDETDRESIPPSSMLAVLGEQFTRFGLYRTFPVGSIMYRARAHDPAVVIDDAEGLGSPPRDAAIMSNRMSPAGVPMFYGALDLQTAVVETFELDRGEKVATVGTFRLERDLRLLDLTHLPPIPGVFDQENRHLRRPLQFLHEFVGELARPIDRDGREHVEYVPTQVVTEFIRHRHHDSDGTAIDGILYRSSRARGDLSFVLFVGPQQCGPRPNRQARAPKTLLTLSGSQTLDRASLTALVAGTSTEL